jgi:hypothetical protein
MLTASHHLKLPPKDKGGPLWQRFFNDAKARGCPDPEKLADTLLRSRERALEIEAARRKVVLVTDVPKPQEAVVAAAPKKSRAAVGDARRCKARTLAGKQCGFKATCGDFCKKHAVTGPRIWHRVNDPGLFTDARLKGYLNFGEARVRQIFGDPNTGAVTEWRVMFDDDTLAIMRFTDGDPALHVLGTGVAALARVREALE